MNRAVLGLALFEDDADYAAFERVLDEARERDDKRICAPALMPNHFHMVLWPRDDGDLSTFMRWLAMTHVQRWHARRRDAVRRPVTPAGFRSLHSADCLRDGSQLDTDNPAAEAVPDVDRVVAGGHGLRPAEADGWPG